MSWCRWCSSSRSCNLFVARSAKHTATPPAVAAICWNIDGCCGAPTAAAGCCTGTGGGAGAARAGTFELGYEGGGLLKEEDKMYGIFVNLAYGLPESGQCKYISTNINERNTIYNMITNHTCVNYNQNTIYNMTTNYASTIYNMTINHTCVNYNQNTFYKPLPTTLIPLLSLFM
uniref:Uncharacterized protein n=1 Tax=Glossina palpalis gambiensis TaxID=67801 RepID=A0A1B0AZY8_9MUSC